MKINGVGVNPSKVNVSQNKEVQHSQEVMKPAMVDSNRLVEDKIESGDLAQDAMMSDDMMAKSIEQANKTLNKVDRRIERTVHDVTHTVMYTIKDTKTDEVIGEFPPKKIQDMIAKMWELAGLFVDEKA